MAISTIITHDPATDETTSSISWQESPEEEYLLLTTDQTLQCLPNIPVCVDYWIRNIWCRSTNTSGIWNAILPNGRAILRCRKLEIICDIDNLTTTFEWEDNQAPDTFYHLKTEWEKQFARYAQFKVFW